MEKTIAPNSSHFSNFHYTLVNNLTYDLFEFSRNIEMTNLYSSSYLSCIIHFPGFLTSNSGGQMIALVKAKSTSVKEKPGSRRITIFY